MFLLEAFRKGIYLLYYFNASSPGLIQENRKFEIDGNCDAKIVIRGKAPNAPARTKNSASRLPALVLLMRLRMASRSISAKIQIIPTVRTANSPTKVQEIVCLCWKG